MNEQLFLPSKFVKKTEKDNFNGLHSTHKKLKKNLNNFSTWFIFSWRWEMFNELPYKKWDSYSEDNLLATKNSNELLPFYEFLPFSVLQRKMYEPFSIYFKQSHSPVSALTFWRFIFMINSFQKVTFLNLLKTDDNYYFTFL